MEAGTESYYIAKIQAGEAEYFSALMDKYSQFVYSLILKMTANREDAEELTQDVFLKAYRSLASFRGGSNFSTWLYRIAYNTAVSATRRQQAEWVSLDDAPQAGVADDDAEDEVAQLNREAQLERLQNALDQLAPDDRGLIMLFYIQGKTMEEISHIADLSLPNVKTRMHRIRKKLLLLMTQHDE